MKTSARVGDTGLPIRVEVLDVNLTGRTVQIRLTKPDASTATLSATLDGKGTEVFAATSAGQLDQAGTYAVDVLVTGSGVSLTLGAGSITVTA